MVASLGLLVVVAILVLVARGSSGAGVPTPLASGVTSTEGSPPDLSTMSPRERFDRLYNRVMTASENGDAQTLETFGPMALLAYAQLDSVDADARYHAALLRLHGGDIPGAIALADTILAAQPTHLFGLIVRGSVARVQKDDAALQKVYAEVLRVWDQEMAAGRQEYADHRGMLDAYKAEASRASGS